MSDTSVDPVNATKLEFSRRVFVGSAAAATLGASALATSLASDVQLGTTHPPLVAEDDPAIVVEHVKLPTTNGSIDAYAARPVHAGPATPCIVLVMHVWGVDTSMRDCARRLAKAGFAVVTPDLYARANPPSGDGVSDIAVFRPFAKGLDRAQYASDLHVGAQWLHAAHPQAKIGVMGFCMGGHIVLQQTIDNASTFAAAAPFYGDPSGIDATAVHMPVCGSYGARDGSIPADGVRAFANALTAPHDIKIYDEAGHAFFDDQRKAYVATAADDAWHRTLDWFHRYLVHA